MQNISQVRESKPAITKAIFIRESTLTVVPKQFVKALGVSSGCYFEHIITEQGLLTRVVQLPGKALPSKSSEVIGTDGSQ